MTLYSQIYNCCIIITIAILFLSARGVLLENGAWNIPILQKFIRKLPKPEILKISNKKYKFCVVGGTFDHIHMGHKTLLTTALMFSEKLLVCITSDAYVKKMRKIAEDRIEPFHLRRKNIEEFLIKASASFVFCELNDPFTPALHSKYASNIDSIAISSDPDVLERTRMLNKLRIRFGLNQLSIIQIPLIRDPYGKIFSSTRYRINDYFPEPHPPELILRKSILDDIRRPKGDIADKPSDLPEPNEFKNKGIIVIGDDAFRNLVKAEYPISVGILDFKAKRVSLSYTVLRSDNATEAIPAIPCFNEAGKISTFSWFSTLISFVQNQSTIIRVFGEEDLMGFPATILAPEGALIVYGDPFLKKLVYYRVNDEHKLNALDLLQKMETSST